MPTKPLDRLMFAQAGLCFFCKEPLAKADASVEHLVASANGGSNGDENRVACCKAVNALLGSMSLKEKIQLVLNRKGQFECPNGRQAVKPAAVPIAEPRHRQPIATAATDKIAVIIANLRQRGPAKPKTVKTLTSAIASLFKKKIAEKEMGVLLQQLEARGVVVVNGTKVSYAPSTEPSRQR